MSRSASATKEPFRMEELWETLADLDEVNSKLASNKIPDDESSKDEDREHFWQGKTGILNYLPWHIMMVSGSSQFL